MSTPDPVVSRNHIRDSIDIIPSQLIALLKIAFTNGQRIMIIGEPGQGKTECARQATRELGMDIVVSHPAVEDSTSITGMPHFESGTDFATFKPFGQLYKVLNATKPTVWFVDDFGLAPGLVQGGYMQYLLGGELNGNKLPDCVVMCVATNERHHKSGVVAILEAVKSRFDAIVRLRSDYEESKRWMYDNNIPTELISFLESRPDLLSEFTPSNDFVNSPTPRSWAKCAKWVKQALDGVLPRDLQLAAYAGCVGAGAAGELLTHLDHIVDMPNLNDIINNPDKGVIPTNPSVMYAVCAGLANRTTAENFNNVSKYIQRLNDNKKTEFASLLLKDATGRAPEVLMTEAFTELASTPLGKFLTNRAELAA